MSGMKRNVVLILAVASAVAAPSAFATYGYFSHGYGMKAKGMAGAVTALTEDTFGGANNPASMVWVGNRSDLGVDWFSPIRGMDRTDAANGLNAAAPSESEDFFIPEFGYNTMINSDMSFGVTVYGNGGMNTNYNAGQINGGGSGVCNAFGVAGTGQNVLCGNTALGVDLAQIIIAPTVAYKITSTNSVGISPLLAYQRFQANGLQGFAGLSNDSSSLTNNGYSSAKGAGVRVGWLGKFTQAVSVGVAYSSKINMSKFKKYQGLFAEGGDFDIPSNYNAGIAFMPSSQMTITLDFQKIKYTDVKAVSNPSTNTGLLGTDDGRGFGWEDVTVKKIGFEMKTSSAMTWRAGYGKTDNPIQSRDVTFNILAPGVVQDHYTLGFTRDMGAGSEMTMAFMHAPEKSVSGTSLFTALGAGNTGKETIKMHQNSLGISWGKKW
jgi:long-chain fatty acid transport protein